VAACLFGAAGSARFWQAWTCLGVNLTAAICACAYFYRRNPGRLERRLLKKETIFAQKFMPFAPSGRPRVWRASLAN
jgi:hypothetical protein